MAMMKFACMMVLCMVVAAPHAEAALSCNQVQTSLTPCLGYLTGRPLVAQCCNGIKALNNAARTTPDRQAVCGCLKAAANAFPNINMGVVASLPGKCGVNIPYKISPSTDCSKIR